MLLCSSRLPTLTTTPSYSATWTLGANRTKVRRAGRLRPPRAFSTKSVLSSRPPRTLRIESASPLLLADLVQALRQVLLVFLQQRRVPRAAVDLADRKS